MDDNDDGAMIVMTINCASSVRDEEGTTWHPVVQRNEDGSNARLGLIRSDAASEALAVGAAGLVQ